MSKHPLLIVGSIAFDDLDMPTGQYRDVLGGAATYSSIAASLLARGRVRAVGIVGSDFPEEHLSDLRGRGIDTAGIERAEGRTFRWHGRYSDDLASRTTIDTQLNVFADFSPKIPPAYERSALVLLGNIHPRLQVDVLDQAREPRLVAADTMNFWIDREPGALADMLRRIDLLIINDEEARQLSGEANLPAAARAIRALGPKAVVIKRGDAGALLFHEAGVFAAPAFPIENVVDPTGAGDSFAGGFMGWMAREGVVDPMTIRTAMILGSVLASFSVEDFSLDRFRRLDLSQIRERFAAFADLVHFEKIKL